MGRSAPGERRQRDHRLFQCRVADARGRQRSVPPSPGVGDPVRGDESQPEGVAVDGRVLGVTVPGDGGEGHEIRVVPEGRSCLSDVDEFVADAEDPRRVAPLPFARGWWALPRLRRMEQRP